MRRFVICFHKQGWTNVVIGPANFAQSDYATYFFPSFPSPKYVGHDSYAVISQDILWFFLDEVSSII